MRSKVGWYIVSAVIVDENDDGEIVDKVTTETVELYGRQALTDHLVSIEQLIAARTAELNESVPAAAETNK